MLFNVLTTQEIIYQLRTAPPTPIMEERENRLEQIIQVNYQFFLRFLFFILKMEKKRKVKLNFEKLLRDELFFLNVIFER